MAKKLIDNELEKNKEQITREIIEDVKKEINDVKKNLKDDIIKEIRFEANTTVKDDIKEQLIIDINNEIKDNVRREQKNIIRSKNLKIFKKNIFILLLIGVIGYFGYCLWDARYFWFMKSKNVENILKKTDKEVIEEQPKEPEIIHKKEGRTTTPKKNKYEEIKKQKSYTYTRGRFHKNQYNEENDVKKFLNYRSRSKSSKRIEKKEEEDNIQKNEEELKKSRSVRKMKNRRKRRHHHRHHHFQHFKRPERIITISKLDSFSIVQFN